MYNKFEAMKERKKKKALTESGHTELMSCFGETHRLFSQNTRQATASCDTHVYHVDVKAAVAFTDTQTGRGRGEGVDPF